MYYYYKAHNNTKFFSCFSPRTSLWGGSYYTCRERALKRGASLYSSLSWSLSL